MNTRGRFGHSGPSGVARDARHRQDADHPAENGAKASGVEERVARERARMVQDRQTELDQVSDRHDTYVRERFHLEKFVTLVSYDPKIAKQDSSTVFREYKSQYDLVEDSKSASSSRLTRKARTERLQALKTTAAPSKTVRSKKKGQDNDAVTAPAPTASTPSISAPVRPRPSRLMPPPEVPASVSTYVGKGKGKAKAVTEDPPSVSPIKRQQRVKNARDSAAEVEDLPPAKRRRIESNGRSFSAAGPEDAPLSHTKHPPESVSATLSSRRKPTKRKLSPNGARSATRRAEPTSPSTSPLKRIKLIVRRPDPVYSSPVQRPPPPRFGSSLSALLSSYTTLDGNDVNEDAIQDRIQQVADFWRRVGELREEGRFFPESVGDDSLPVSPPQRGPNMNTSQDTWSHIIEAVKDRATHRPTSGRQVAAQVASRVRAYWEGRAVKDDKLKLQEEKRLRALAKATIRHVIDEWKKAVHHIRREEQLRREEEERIRGQEHLDAILDQSGQILTAQQLDLSKATPRSRSSSVSAALSRWASASPEPDDALSSEADGAAVSDEEGEESDESEPEEGADISLLLGDGAESMPRSPSSRSRSSLGPTTTENASVEQTPEPDSGIASQSRRSRSVSTSIHVESIPVRTPSPSPTPTVEHYIEYADSETPIPPSYSPGKADWGDIFPFAASSGSFDFSAHDDEAISVAVTKTTSSVDGEVGPSSVSAHLTNGGTLDHMDIDQATPVPEDSQDVGTSESQSMAEDLPHEDVAPSSDFVPDDEMVTSPQEPQPDLAALEMTPTENDAEDVAAEAEEELSSIPVYLRPYAVAPVEWDPSSPVKAPFLLRGNLRPYQQAGLEWLASLHINNLNGILADEMGLGKTIQTISLLAHLACERGIWGPHLIIVPTSVLLNWEMEFKKFLPGFKVLSYHGSTKQRKELRQGWNNKYHFNVCVTSYTLASRDAHVFKRKAWYYMILDEAHMIKNFRSQRWNILLMFRSFRRLLLTGTPLQNNLTELWALLQFLMSGSNFANLKEFGEWFANPLEKAIEMGTMDDETQQRVSKLHMVLRPYLLRRLKRDVEKELPQKFEHLVMCPLSKRQRFLYDEFMARADTRYDLQSGVYQKIANILMQLRKVVNHPDLFEVRPIVTSFAMERSAIADFEIKELLVRRRLFAASDNDYCNLDLLGLQFIQKQNTSSFASAEIRSLDGTPRLPMITELPGEPPPYDTRTISGFRRYREWSQRASEIAKWSHFGYINRLRCSPQPIYGEELIRISQRLYSPLLPLSSMEKRPWTVLDRINSAVKSYAGRAEEMADTIARFAFVTPAVIARDLPRITLAGREESVLAVQRDAKFDQTLHRAAIKLQIAFPDPSLLQYDCGKLQELARLLRERKAGGHRILIFTQMTRILDILETFLNFHGYLYLRLDGATKIEDRQYITERFNSDSRVFCFIASSRSGGVGINLTGADTVVFYDSDFNPQMDRQCEDRAHRIGQIRDVHIYRFISTHTVEEALLRKANQKRTLDNIVIQKGEFDWHSLLSNEAEKELTKALGDVEDEADALAAAVAAREEVELIGEDERDFGAEGGADKEQKRVAFEDIPVDEAVAEDTEVHFAEEQEQEAGEDEEEGGTTVDYMLAFVRFDMDHFVDWRL
ncbi:SNF2 family N-terminal domain-containing protein [Fomitopsis serialis]|uniref:SNF2 family N-terminal domain-containing protein n=1 Tax=Fomitopsis serialis TaxID=139415 RepID=UPI00200783B4|nr:SNF2 family N-terminal domain-containing protein [Neoantrodia serialis]KAH9915412.1 SNF2 family N-terminal domain-containing protein [Neoantrodia serialis]